MNAIFLCFVFFAITSYILWNPAPILGCIIGFLFAKIWYYFKDKKLSEKYGENYDEN